MNLSTGYRHGPHRQASHRGSQNAQLTFLEATVELCSSRLRDLARGPVTGCHRAQPEATGSMGSMGWDLWDVG